MEPNDIELRDDISVSDFLDMQRRLQAQFSGKWTPLTPDHGRSSLLWMIEEIGEAAAVIKKRGEAQIMSDPAVREAFIEEFADVMMYFYDALLCYGVDAAEFSRIYINKHNRNMLRDYENERAYKS